MATLAYLDATGQDRINNATFLNTLIDFSEPGVMGVFTDERTVAKLERSMQKTGFLPAENMATTFNLMRGNDLIWNYVVSNWLLGQEPPAVRPVDLERRFHPDAGQHALVLPAQLLPGEPAGPGSNGARRAAARPVHGGPGPVLRHRRAGPHRAVAQLLHRRPAGRRRGPVRAVELRAHRRHRQPAQPEVAVLRERHRGTAGGSRRVVVRGDDVPGDLVGGLGELDREARGPSAPRRTGQREVPRAGRRPGTYIFG